MGSFPRKSKLIQKINALHVQTTLETCSRIEHITHNFRNGQSLYCGGKLLCSLINRCKEEILVVKVAGYRPTAKMATVIHILLLIFKLALKEKEYLVSSEASQADFNLNKEY